MTTLNATHTRNAINPGNDEPKVGWWSRFLERLELALSGAAGLSTEQMEELEPEDLAHLGYYWMM